MLNYYGICFILSLILATIIFYYKSVSPSVEKGTTRQLPESWEKGKFYFLLIFYIHIIPLFIFIIFIPYRFFCIRTINSDKFIHPDNSKPLSFFNSCIMEMPYFSKTKGLVEAKACFICIYNDCVNILKVLLLQG